jgi:hypothetical protein
MRIPSRINLADWLRMGLLILFLSACNGSREAPGTYVVLVTQIVPVTQIIPKKVTQVVRVTQIVRVLETTALPATVPPATKAPLAPTAIAPATAAPAALVAGSIDRHTHSRVLPAAGSPSSHQFLHPRHMAPLRKLLSLSICRTR